jgi:AcrR family transcriptional regulator
VRGPEKTREDAETWDTVTPMTNATTTKKAPRRVRGEYAKTRERRETILDAALEVFAEGGYRAGSLREVAQRVSMSEAGLLHHFPSKVALLEAVLSHRDDRSREMVPLDSDDPHAALRGVVALAAHNATVPGVVELYCTLSAEATAPDHPAHAYFVRRYETTRAAFVRSFSALSRQGRLRPGVSPERAAVALIALWDGLQVQWLLSRDAVDIADALHECIDALADVDWDEPGDVVGAREDAE